MATKADLLPGTLDLLILKAVSLGPLHGYGVLLRIQQISGGALTVEQGALYPALYRLEEQGLLDRDLALTALKYLRHRGHQVVVLHVTDLGERELAGPPEVRFRDPETNERLVVRPRELARAYRLTVEREIAAWRAACRRHGIAYHDVTTDQPFGHVLRRLA